VVVEAGVEPARISPYLGVTRPFKKSVLLSDLPVIVTNFINIILSSIRIGYTLLPKRAPLPVLVEKIPTGFVFPHDRNAMLHAVFPEQLFELDSLPVILESPTINVHCLVNGCRPEDYGESDQEFHCLPPRVATF